MQDGRSFNQDDTIQNVDSNMFRSRFNGLRSKEEEEEHFSFLNQMRQRLNVDSQKIVDLEARITGKYTFLVLNRYLYFGIIERA
jgi:hypothetical protein